MIDLRSDTVTRPSDSMREAAAEAPVGDDVYGDDPTINELEDRAAELVGMDAAMFVPSGTMGNQIAIRVHTERGAELLCDEQAHVYKWEVGGIAQLSGVQARTFDAGESAAPTAEQVTDGYVEESLHRPGTDLLTLENTHNSRGGVAVPRDRLAAPAEAAHELGVSVHLDGARLFNACVATDTEPETMTEPVDSVMFCLSKGLGAPVGSMVAGSESFIEQARRTRKLFGGGMRQAGMIAAPGLHALDNVDRLQTDHDNASRLAEGLRAVPGLRVPEPDTNLVMVDCADAGLTAEEFVALGDEQGIAFSAFDETTCRLCTHLDVDRAAIDTVVDRIATAIDAR